MGQVISIAEYLERQSVLHVESTIPEGMTIEEWRRHPRRHLAAPAQPCGHLHDTTTRYDHERKLLSFLVVCPVCDTEKVLETQRYEPRFNPSSAPGEPLRRAA
jgi:hypothetical protein